MRPDGGALKASIFGLLSGAYVGAQVNASLFRNRAPRENPKRDIRRQWLKARATLGHACTQRPQNPRAPSAPRRPSRHSLFMDRGRPARQCRTGIFACPARRWTNRQAEMPVLHWGIPPMPSGERAHPATWHGLPARGLAWHGLPAHGIEWHGLPARVPARGMGFQPMRPGVEWHGRPAHASVDCVPRATRPCVPAARTRTQTTVAATKTRQRLGAPAVALEYKVAKPASPWNQQTWQSAVRMRHAKHTGETPVPHNPTRACVPNGGAASLPPASAPKPPSRPRKRASDWERRHLAGSGGAPRRRTGEPPVPARETRALPEPNTGETPVPLDQHGLEARAAIFVNGQEKDLPRSCF
jgi:hypothetical protein